MLYLLEPFAVFRVFYVVFAALPHAEPWGVEGFVVIADAHTACVPISEAEHAEVQALHARHDLRGRVLPVGGIKEKILAAKRSGINTIVISEDNRKDVEDIKDIYIKGLTFIYVKNIKDVIDCIF